jgi:hypothetical protein
MLLSYFAAKVTLDGSNKASTQSERHRLQPMRVLIDDVSVESGSDLDDGVGGNIVERGAGADVIKLFIVCYDVAAK